MAQVQQLWKLFSGTISKRSFNLDKEALISLLKKYDIMDDIPRVLSGMDNLSAQVVYGTSKKGFNVAGIRLFNGGESVGSIAASLSGQGVDDAVVKLRTSVGKNGKYAQGNLLADFGKEINLDSADMNISLNNGVCKFFGKFLDACKVNMKLNLKDSADDLVGYATKHNCEFADKISHLNYHTVVGIINKATNNFIKQVKDVIRGTADDIDPSKIEDILNKLIKS